MKGLIFTVILLGLMGCKKDEKFLMSGTWTIDKVVSTTGTDNDGVTTVQFFDNGTYQRSDKSTPNHYFADDKYIYFGPDNTTSPATYEAGKKSLVIHCEIPYDDIIPDIGGVTTYLSK